jgi:hypothetical protein
VHKLGADSRRVTRLCTIYTFTCAFNIVRRSYQILSINYNLQRITKFTIPNIRQIKKCSVHPLFYHRTIRQFLWDINIIEFIVLLSITALVLRGQHKAKKEDEKHAGEYAGRDDCPRNMISRKKRGVIANKNKYVYRGIPRLVSLLPHERASSITDSVCNQDNCICRRSYPSELDGVDLSMSSSYSLYVPIRWNQPSQGESQMARKQKLWVGDNRVRSRTCNTTFEKN